jgi:putative addiction module component (TIGR02574 family)
MLALMNDVLRDEIAKMTVEQRLALIDALWESIGPAGPPSAPLTEVQRAELERRLETIDQDEAHASPWEDVRARFQQRRPY